MRESRSVGWGCHNGVFSGTAVGCRATATARSLQKASFSGQTFFMKPFETILRKEAISDHALPPRGVAAPRRIPGHPRRSRRGIPDRGRPTAKGASEARAGQPGLLGEEGVHGGWWRRIWGPRRVAGAGTAAGQRQGGARVRRGGGAGAREHVGAGRERAQPGRQCECGQGLHGAAEEPVGFGVRAARRSLRDTTPPGPKVSRLREGSVGTTATLADAPGAGSRSSEGRARLLQVRSWLYPKVPWTAAWLQLPVSHQLHIHP